MKQSRAYRAEEKLVEVRPVYDEQFHQVTTWLDSMETPMGYTLFIDDERQVFDPTWVVARTVAEAQKIVQERGLPSFMSLDHDLGGDETVMQFLHWLSQNYYETGSPEYQIHSANPVGRENIGAFLRSWNKSLII